jgi:hypothetical protein
MGKGKGKGKGGMSVKSEGKGKGTSSSYPEDDDYDSRDDSGNTVSSDGESSVRYNMKPFDSNKQLGMTKLGKAKHASNQQSTKNPGEKSFPGSHAKVGLPSLCGDEHSEKGPMKHKSSSHKIGSRSGSKKGLTKSKKGKGKGKGKGNGTGKGKGKGTHFTDTASPVPTVLYASLVPSESMFPSI